MTRVAVLIDGDNVSPAHAARIMDLARAAGRVDVVRVYADVTNGSGWSETPGCRLIHAGRGKNAADILLSIDTVEMMFAGAFDTALIVSSDSDFTHLAFRLRERGIDVIGLGEAKAPAAFRAACSEFEELSPARRTREVPIGSPVSALDRQIRTVIERHSRNGSGMRLCDLNARMRAEHEIRISTRPERTWRAYLGQRPALFDLDARGPDAHVRFRPAGFRAS